MLRRPWVSPFSRFLVALMLVIGSLLFRLWLERWCPPNRFIFSSFYMAVMLAAYFLGSAAAIFTVILSAALGYWVLLAPEFSWKADPVEWVSLAFFCLTSAVDIYFITAMKRAVTLYRAERQRFEILAEGHAALFQNYNERTANYLNLLSIILERSAKGTADPDMTMIGEASRHAFALASLHRSRVDEGSQETVFLVFAKQLLENLARTVGARSVVVQAVGDSVGIASDRAALMAIILAEWAHQARPAFQDGGSAELDLNFRLWDDKLHLGLRVRGAGDLVEISSGNLPGMKIVDAILDHLGGRASITTLGGDLNFEMIAPLQAPSAATTVGQVPHFVPMPSTMTVN